MKKKTIDDHDVLNAFQDAAPYQIATSAEKILSKAEPAHKRIPWALPLSLGGALLLAGSLAAVFLLLPNPIDDPAPLPALSPQKNQALGRELLSFHSFAGPKENEGTNLFKRRNATLTESDFLRGVRGYEEIQDGVRTLFDTPSYSWNDEDAGGYAHEGISYDRRCEIVDEDASLVATYYYNLAAEEGDEKEYQGLYQEGGRFYSVRVVFESEEDETEVSSLFIPLGDADTTIHLMQKEQEFEGMSSESSYAYARFSSFEDYEAEEPISVLAYEFEDGILEASFEQGDEEWEFADIKKTGGASFSFILEEMSGSSVADIPYSLTYGESGSRHYVSGSFEAFRR